MHTLHLGQSLAVAVALCLLLLIVGVIGLGVASWHDDVVPPKLHVSVSGLRILAHITDPTECQPKPFCPDATRYYRVYWVSRETAPDYVHETWRRVLSVPLQR
jgi:hypothetical protein